MQPRTDRPEYLRVGPNRPTRITRSFTRNTRNKNIRTIPTKSGGSRPRVEQQLPYHARELRKRQPESRQKASDDGLMQVHVLAQVRDRAQGGRDEFLLLQPARPPAKFQVARYVNHIIILFAFSYSEKSANLGNRIVMHFLEQL